MAKAENSFGKQLLHLAKAHINLWSIRLNYIDDLFYKG